MLEKLKAGEEVEAMIIENLGRTIRRDGKLRKEGGFLIDSFTGEWYPITTKPLLAYRKKKSIPVYLVDRDAGVTVTLTTEKTKEKSSETMEIPDELTNDNMKCGGCTVEILRDPETVAKLSCDPVLAGRVMESTILQDEFGAPLSGREKLLFMLAGMVICFVLLKMFGG